VARRAQPYGWGERTSFLRAYANGARITPFTQAWNVAGFPAMSLPFGATATTGATATAPGSVQLVTAPGRESSLFALATTLAASQSAYGV
jgi:amidase